MQQFVVPQFIDVENKILGPITSRQFVLLIVWGLLEFGAYRFLDTVAFGIITFVFFLIFFPITFLKFNGKPFHFLLVSMVRNKTKPQIRVWNHLYKPPRISETKSARELREEKRKTSILQFAEKRTKPSKLSELSLIIDTGGIYEGEQTPEEMEKAFESLQKPNKTT